MAILSSPTPISPLPPETVIVPCSFTLTDGANIAVDATQGEIAKVQIAGNRTLDTPSGGIGGQRLVVVVQQDAVGGRTLAFSADYDFTGFVATPPVNPTATTKTIYQFIFDQESNLWRCIGATSAAAAGDFAVVSILAAASSGVVTVDPAFNGCKCVCSLKTNAGIVHATDPIMFKGAVAAGILTVTSISGFSGAAAVVAAAVTVDVALGF